MNPLATASQRLADARTALVLDHPFFGALALRLKFVESPQTDTMATDGTSLFYSPAWVQTQTDAQLKGTIAHEVMHCALNHHTRRCARNPRKWNVAADYVINPIVADAGMELPDGALIDRALSDGCSTEQVYAKLPDAPPEDPNGDGSKSGQQPAPAGGVLDAADPVESAADWQVATVQATQAARMMGKLPAAMAEAIGRQTRPETDWKAITQRFVQETATADYSWKMPNRRYIASGLYLPSLKSEQMPPLAVFIDTSGSTRPYRETFMAHIQTIVDEVRPERTYLIHVDTKVARVDVFERDEPLTLTEIHGGGGTRFEPGFEYLAAEGIEPACIIYLTDGEGTFPPASDIPTLWAITTDVEAPWGETVRVAG